jgi:2'-5' RNA ligase
MGPTSGTAAPALRLFLALELPEAAQAAIAAAGRRLAAGRDELRPVAAESLHVTLVFLGRRGEDQVARIAALAEAVVAEHGAARLAPGRLEGLPPRRPRLLALGLEDEDGRSGALQAGLAGALAGAGLHRPEKRPFWTHVTIARVRRGQRTHAPAEALDGLAPFTADRVVLFRSLLHPRGARYEPLWAATLAASRSND